MPGKEEFHETLRYFRSELKLSGVDVQLSTRVVADDLAGCVWCVETALVVVAPVLPARRIRRLKAALRTREQRLILHP